MNQDTICAVATAQGGVIGMIRTSGPDAITITDKIFIPAKSNKELKNQKPYTLTFGQVYNGEEPIDEVLIGVFHSPHSYTGEDSTEITCHGSPYIIQQIMQLLIANGCRMARPGEYTQRAFLNGKMDLSQAEAVADLISSSSAATHRLAMNQMRGGFSKELDDLRTRLLHFTSMIELELDFNEEDVEFANRNELRLLSDEIENTISRLVYSFGVGNAIKNGIPVTIVGETNVGKSTLLNILLNEEKAIVSNIHGTTRDIIEDTVSFNGINFRFIDTAGIRETVDEIENLGIERAFQKLDQAEIVFWVIDAVDARKQFKKLSGEILSRSPQKQIVLVLNKVDLINDNQKEELISFLSLYEQKNVNSVFISAKQRIGIGELQKLLIKLTHLPTVTQNDVVVTNIRHYESLTRALESIHRVQEGLQMNISGDFLAQDIRECIFHLGDIVGEVTSEMVLKNIFEKFCIGK
ncbi:tRNA modification GTPase MnmE [termite gut metagenome]|uniref:tRNA modification GTPase MnmE n=1 Tax=termite gut metagenome TaxID=433724 RepID=A0A5J4SWV2_9ZZZZ